MDFHWSLSKSKSPQVSRTLLSILAVLNNTVVWMVSTRLPTSKSSSPFSNHLVTVPKAPIKIGTIITFMFNRFFNSLASSRYLSFFSYSFSIIQWSAETAKSTILKILFIIIIIIIYSFRVFHISVSWWSFTKIWVRASLLKSPGLISGFWPFPVILSFEWFPLGRQLPSPPGYLEILMLLFQTYQLQLV